MAGSAASVITYTLTIVTGPEIFERDSSLASLCLDSDIDNKHGPAVPDIVSPSGSGRRKEIGEC